MPESPRLPTVVVVGDARHHEFSAPLKWLQRRAEVAVCADPVEALRRFDATEAESSIRLPQLVVIAQPRPAMFRREDVERLHARVPLARFVTMLGSGCEGELRTGEPWPGVVRVYWHQFIQRGRSEWERLLAGLPSTWSLPRTSTPADAALLTASRPQPRVTGVVAVGATQWVEFDGISAALRRLGATVVWLPPNRPLNLEGTDLLIWDSDGRTPHEFKRMQHARDRLRPSAVIAILGFPRTSDFRLFREAGADHVLSKPFLLDDLIDLTAIILPAAEQTIADWTAA